MTTKFKFESKFKPGQTVLIADGDFRAVIYDVRFERSRSEPLLRVEWWVDAQLKSAVCFESEVSEVPDEEL